MKSFYVLLVSILLTCAIKAQEQFSYSFKATSDSTTLSQYAQELESIKGVESVKFRYKKEKEAGEFMIFSQKGTKQNPYPLNSAADDFGLVVDSTGKSGFFSTDRDDFIDNIYSWKRESIYIELAGKLVVQYDEKEPMMFEKLQLVNRTDHDTITIETDGFGKFITPIKEDKEYLLSADKNTLNFRKKNQSLLPIFLKIRSSGLS